MQSYSLRLLILTALITRTASLLQPQHQNRQSTITSIRHPTALSVFFANENDKRKNKSRNNNSISQNNNSEDLLQTLQLKDEALSSANTAVSSLENALESAVSNLESMQSKLQRQVRGLEDELSKAKRQVGDANRELQQLRLELEEARADLVKEGEVRDMLEGRLYRSQQEALKNAERVELLEGYLNDIGVDASSVGVTKVEQSNPWQLWGQSKSLTPTPILNDWVIIRGSTDDEIQISGKVSGHRSIPDGDAIVTSPLLDPKQAAEKKVVTTVSGSKYKLGTPMVVPEQQQQQSAKPKPSITPSKQVAASRASIALPDLTGNTLGNGRYLLAGTPTPSINGRSFIQTAYRSSPLNKPYGEPLAIKVSGNKEAMKREFNNYQKVAAGFKRGDFIRRIEFLPVAGQEMADKSALVMQRGIADVKAFMPKVGGRLEGKMLYDCAMTALQCVQALHGAKLVWNDLKTENFVVIEEPSGFSFKGIDLESCMPVRESPVDYTPEACPPEFARAFLDGEADTFLLEYSYDVWSYGMFLYEISTGRGFFDGYTAEKITKMLPDFEPNVDDVPDVQLADLISQCLTIDPKSRPSFVRIARHPYFSTWSNKTPFDFLFGSSI